MVPHMADENSADSTHTYSNLILTGFTLGVVHVLAGPDHLSALATLSVGVRVCMCAFLRLRKL